MKTRLQTFLILLALIVIGCVSANADPPAGNYSSPSVTGNGGPRTGGGGGATPTPTPGPTMGPVAGAPIANPVSTYPPPQIYDANNGNNGSDVILSGYYTSTVASDYSDLIFPNSVIETAGSSASWTTAHSIAQNGEYFSAYTTTVEYSGASGSSLSYWSIQYALGQNEPLFEHLQDPGKTLMAPLSTSQCLITFQTNFFDTGGNDTYLLYNGANDAFITSLTASGGANGTGQMTYTWSGLASGTTYSVYVNWLALNTVSTAPSSISSGVTTAITVPAGKANKVDLGDFIIICDNASAITSCTNSEVVRVNDLNPSANQFWVTPSKVHSCTGGCTFYEEKPYTGVDPLDNLTGTDPIGTNYMVNIPYRGYTASYPGKRLTMTANANGAKLPTCTTATPSSQYLTALDAAPSPNPRPPTYTASSTATPAPGTAVAPKVSFFETSTAQATPTLYYCYATTCSTWTSLGSTWTTSSTSFANTTKYTWNGGTIASKAIKVAIAFEVCVNGGTPPGPTANCTAPFSGQQTENERLTNGKGGNGIRQMIACNPRMIQAITEIAEGVLGVGLMAHWDSRNGLTTPIRGRYDTIRFDDFDLWLYNNTGPEIKYTQDIYLLDGSTTYSNDVTGQDFECEYGTAAQQLYTQEVNNSTTYGAANPWHMLNAVGANNTSLQTQANDVSGESFDLFDGFQINGGAYAYTTMQKRWFDMFEDVLIDEQHNVLPILHPSQDTCATDSSCNSHRLDAYASYLLLVDDPVNDGHNLASFRNSDSNQVLYAEYYLPLGHSLAPLPTFLGPAANCYQGVSGCNFGSSGGLWHSGDGMYERCFTHGCVFLCPPSGGTSQATCQTINMNSYFGQATMYELNPTTASIETGGTGSTRTYTAITSLSLSPNQAAIILYNQP